MLDFQRISLHAQHFYTQGVGGSKPSAPNVAREAVQRKKVPLDDLRKALIEHWKKNNPDNKSSDILTYDGNHFNQAGMEFVAQHMLKMLNQ